MTPRSIRRIDLRAATRDGRVDPVDYRAVVPRAPFDVEAAAGLVQPICDDVRTRGVPAIVEASARFDSV